MNKCRPRLSPGVLYLTNDRLVCDHPTCAGATAMATGRTRGGLVLIPLDVEDLFEAALEDGETSLTCECCRLTVTLTTDRRLRGRQRVSAPAPSGCQAG